MYVLTNKNNPSLAPRSPTPSVTADPNMTRKNRAGKNSQRARNHPNNPPDKNPPDPSTETPKPKTKYVPPQPEQSYREPPTLDSDDMSESENNSLVNLSSSSSQASALDHQAVARQLIPTPNFFAGLENTQSDQEMALEDSPDHNIQKRKRADTNPDDVGTPPSTRSFQSSLPQNPPSNQLGIYNSPSPGPALSQIHLGANVSTAALTDDAISSTPRSARPPHPANKRGPYTSRLPTPNVKDLDVTGFIGDNPMIGIEPQYINTWKDIQGNKALIYPHDASYSDENKVKIGADMARAIALHLNAPAPFVTAPGAIVNFDKRKSGGFRPWTYLVSGLSEEGLDTILNDAFIENQHAVLHVIPFPPGPSHYIGRIKNLTYDTDCYHTVTKLIFNSILEDASTMKYITDFVTAHHDLIPNEIRKRNIAVDWVLSSIKAFHIQKDNLIGIENSQWKWYIYTPTETEDHVTRWTQTLAGLTFNAGVYGIGETVTDIKCSRCKSTNHNHVECPFSKRSQFISPLPTKKPNTNTRGGRGGKRGGNSNSRGRN